MQWSCQRKTIYTISRLLIYRFYSYRKLFKSKYKNTQKSWNTKVLSPENLQVTEKKYKKRGAKRIFWYTDYITYLKAGVFI